MNKSRVSKLLCDRPTEPHAVGKTIPAKSERVLNARRNFYLPDLPGKLFRSAKHDQKINSHGTVLEE